MRVPTGVKGFDELIQGGLPEGACVVLEGPTGVEKTQFATGFLIEGLRRGEAILVVLASEPPSAFFEKLREKGFDPDRLYEEGRLRVVDWYSQREESVVEVEEVGVVIKSSLDLLNVGIAITRAIASLAKDSQKRAVVEILSPALSIYDLPQVHTFAQATKAKLSRHNLTTLFLVEREMHDSTTLSTLLQPFDGAIDIDRAREGDRIVRKLAVLSLKGTSAQSTYVPFDIAMDGSLELAGGAAETAPRKVETAGSDKPRDAGLWLSLGKMLAQSGRLEKALVSLESCTKIDPQNSEAWTLKADILRKMGRDDEAEEALAIIQVLGPASKAEPSKPAKPTRKSEKILRILESSEERLSKRKDDTDALFAKATALAALEQNDKALDTLNELTKVNHKYPGLWLLKAKIYAAAGDPDKAQLCRKRALETDREAEAQETPPLPEEIPEPQPPKVQFECPICNSLVDEEATQCPSCDAIFAEGAPAPPQPSLPPGKPKELPVPKAPDKSKVTPPPGVGKPPKVGRARAQKGRTNGLTNGLRGRTNGLTNGLRGRTNGLTNGLKGKTNGLKGRTNGLTNGLRGRTNGLTNGLRGRTNGLTNGLRGRTNGLTNGLRGRTNGLTNGVKQGAGKVNGLATEGRASGVTNGLVNGLRGLRTGITNGLTNGNGFTNGLGSGKFRRQARGYRWKLYTIPLVAFMLLIIPVMLPNVVRTPSYVIRIDGEFGDWASQRVVAMQPDPAVSPNIMIREVSVVDNLDYLSFYVEVQGSILQGGPQPERLMDSVRAFIDLDRSPTTGYLVRGVGAERMVEVWGWGGSAMIARVWSTGRPFPRTRTTGARGAPQRTLCQPPPGTGWRPRCHGRPCN